MYDKRSLFGHSPLCYSYMCIKPKEEIFNFKLNSKYVNYDTYRGFFEIQKNGLCVIPLPTCKSRYKLKFAMHSIILILLIILVIQRDCCLSGPPTWICIQL